MSDINEHFEMQDVLDFWLNRGVDGFYINSVPYFLEDEDFNDNFADSSSSTFGLADNVALLYRFREYIDAWVSLNDNMTKYVSSAFFVYYILPSTLIFRP